MTHPHTPALPASKRFAWLIALLAALTVLLCLGHEWPAAQAWATPPATLDVVQNPSTPRSVAPGEAVTFTITQTLQSAALNLTIKGTLNNGLAFAQSPFGAPYTGICTSSGQSFTCNAGGVGAGDASPLVVSAYVRPGADDTTITQPAGSFSTQDGATVTSGPVVSGPTSDLATLTVQNRTLAITNSASSSGVFEGDTVTFTAGILNVTPSAASGPYAVTMSVPNGTVKTATCPLNTTLTINLPSTATCADPSGLAAGATASPPMSVVVQANDLTGSGTLTSTVSVAPYVLATGTLTASVPVTELNLTTATPSVNTGATVTVCTTNMAASGLAGFSSGSNTFTTADYIFTASGGASATSRTVATCPSGQQGISFTSPTAGSITVAAGYNTVGRSNPVTVAFTSASNPAPALSNITPTTAAAGSGGFTLTVNGTGFVDGVTAVRWNGTPRTTTCPSSTQCIATILDADVATAATRPVTVFNPTPGGGTSSSQTFTVSVVPNPSPTISDMSPDTIVAMGPQFTLTVNGTGFVATSVVKWDSTSLSTHFVSDTQLTATVPAASIAAPKTANITVFNPTPGGGTSPALPFTVTTAAAQLAFTKQPGNGVSGAPLSAQPQVAIQTTDGKTVTTDSTTTVTLALVGNGTLSCTGGLTKTASSGLATFAGCSVTGAAATGLTLTATADSLDAATSSAFNLTAAPAVQSTQLVVAAPAAGVSIPRSRLTFTATAGTISPAPTAVTFVIKRKSDNQYWNDSAGAWQADPFENAAIASDTAGTWTFAVTGENRRQFVGTTVVVTAHASTDAALYESTAKPEIAIR